MNQGLDLDLRLENLVITGACLSSRKDRVVLYAIRREPSEFGGLVISLVKSSQVAFNEQVTIAPVLQK